jgi:hypothetical protein
MAEEKVTHLAAISLRRRMSAILHSLQSTHMPSQPRPPCLISFQTCGRWRSDDAAIRALRRISRSRGRNLGINDARWGRAPLSVS